MSTNSHQQEGNYPSLPPALLAKLQKRGIINQKKEEEENTSQQPQQHHQHPQRQEQFQTTNPNLHHLPPPWQMLHDANSGCPYYWNTATNEVSWTLPKELDSSLLPSTPPQPTLATPIPTHEALGHDPNYTFKMPEKPDINRRQQAKDRPKPYTKQNPRRRDHQYKPRSSDELDPLDPSSYSDAPRGNWSSGIKAEGKAKTGVDETANGPLFQQRPYPSPGQILKMKKK
ncbi:uncharacterized protein TRIADDRAFT_55399 [Trichoplax adhaerens]|uniref:WW domain-containing protein n=1 Tax=Trichoplax adhaerens TaxID=10228 RepID=B3RUS9_TRIAD|nr:hypothetical protein TRIADDRAFT_55399 [Trichoplax adhaerens]EDV25875.1 hypothetical protein TRIADDRAFT_55399 [Trichoplax adhaerens]|eukprot:XP_002111908.1 hypothetical protein TRIADDRAFT_55399 [Trichoplax adhaerens]